jgi:hypothetical protein
MTQAEKITEEMARGSKVIEILTALAAIPADEVERLNQAVSRAREVRSELASIGGAEYMHRTTYGTTTDGRPCCCYCGAVIDNETDAVPGTDEEWRWASADHSEDCEWVATRGHSL